MGLTYIINIKNTENFLKIAIKILKIEIKF